MSWLQWWEVTDEQADGAGQGEDMSDYTHPDSGRVYREGDPAHRFAQLADGLARQCEEFLSHYERRFEGRDYLQQHTEWLSDPDRITRAMRSTLAAIDEAYTAVVVDRDLHTYGLGAQDDEWRRRYGRPQT